jgi:putative CocE/NonD family hydrolase
MMSTTNCDLHWGIKIPLRDGTQLNATLYTPRDQRAPAPLALALTPYIADHCHDRAAYFASHGMPSAIVDVRGRGNSEGIFRPYIQEAKDGYDVVEWLARQPYCNGQVAMWHGSYLGYVQWATAKEFPPHLVTIVPTAAPYIGVDFPMRSNIRFPFIVQWITLISGRASQSKLFSDSAFWSEFFRRWHESGKPFRDLDAMLGNPSAVFQEWLNHPEPDEYWDAYNPTADQYARLQMPILTITGTYDDDQPGALQHYKEHIRNASPAARAQHYLIIGPWDHAGTNTPRSDFGGLKVGAASLIDMSKLHLEWFAWAIGGGSKPGFLQKPVAYYVMGAERWRYADTLEEVTGSYESLFLDSSGNANDVFMAGSLRTVPGVGPPDAYRYDPRDANGPEVDAETHAKGDSLVDQSVVVALRGKQLVYHSAPFEKDTEISGFFHFSAWISIDCPDTDLYVAVHAIALDGSSIRLSTDAVRARYREGRRAQKLIHTREPFRYDFDRFTFVAHQIKSGHRLRLVIAPVGRLIEAIFTEKNFNGGGVVAEESARDARPATVTLFHDGDHPSALQVPLGRVEAAGEPAPPLSLAGNRL